MNVLPIAASAAAQFSVFHHTGRGFPHVQNEITWSKNSQGSMLRFV
jgi:hypothetical protein